MIRRCTIGTVGVTIRTRSAAPRRSISDPLASASPSACVWSAAVRRPHVDPECAPLDLLASQRAPRSRRSGVVPDPRSPALRPRCARGATALRGAPPPTRIPRPSRARCGRVRLGVAVAALRPAPSPQPPDQHRRLAVDLVRVLRDVVALHKGHLELGDRHLLRDLAPMHLLPPSSPPPRARSRSPFRSTARWSAPSPRPHLGRATHRPPCATAARSPDPAQALRSSCTSAAVNCFSDSPPVARDTPPPAHAPAADGLPHPGPVEQRITHRREARDACTLALEGVLVCADLISRVRLGRGEVKRRQAGAVEASLRRPRSGDPQPLPRTEPQRPSRAPRCPFRRTSVASPARAVAPRDS